MVANRLGHLLAGALVEVLDGPRAGTKTLTDGAGKFELSSISALNPQQTGQAERSVTLRAIDRARDRALDLFSVSVDGRPGFFLYRVGRFFLFMEELFEDLPGLRFLMIGGSGTTDPPIDTGTSLTVPFFGTFQFCQLKSARAITSCEQVPPEQIVAFHSCSSDRDRMTFTKR